MVVSTGRRQNADVVPWPRSAAEVRARAATLAGLIQAGLALVPDRPALARHLAERDDVVHGPPSTSTAFS